MVISHQPVKYLQWMTSPRIWQRIAKQPAKQQQMKKCNLCSTRHRNGGLKPMRMRCRNGTWLAARKIVKIEIY